MRVGSDDKSAVKKGFPSEGESEWGGTDEHSMDSWGQLGSLKEGRDAKDEMYSLTHCPRPLSAIPLINKTPFIPLGGIHLDAKEEKYVLRAWKDRGRDKLCDTHDQMKLSKSQDYLLVQQQMHCHPYCIILSNNQPHCSKPPKTIRKFSNPMDNYTSSAVSLSWSNGSSKARFSFQSVENKNALVSVVSCGIISNPD